MKLERIAKLLQDDPPGIRGIMDGGVIYLLRSWNGHGISRVFIFDILGTFTYRDVLHRYKDVVVKYNGEEKLDIIFDSSYVECPACGITVRSKLFWAHYNSAHAKRPYWLNRDDWPIMLDDPYKEPPEFSR